MMVYRVVRQKYADLKGATDGSFSKLWPAKWSTADFVRRHIKFRLF